VERDRGTADLQPVVCHSFMRDLQAASGLIKRRLSSRTQYNGGMTAIAQKIHRAVEHAEHFRWN